jgi:uncharacterized protein (UPF0333 family)
MTPKEKAKELVSKYIHLAKQTTGENGTIYNSKQCALIAVDEITKALRKGLPEIGVGKGYWYSVKQEIEKL